MARKLCIAASVFFGLATVALCVLWVRSYWRIDVVHCPTARPLLVNSARGVFQLNFMLNDINTGWQSGWGWRSFPPERMAPQIQNGPSWSWNSDRYVTTMSFPAWPLVLMSSFVAACLWYSPRFSLCTLLIATTLVSVMLGLGVSLAR